MTDRELLDAAAKAAGLLLRFDNERWSYLGSYIVTEDADGEMYTDWNPLTDDGDALRLAVAMGFVVDCSRPSAAPPFQRHSVLPHDATDPYAATRRAIVRAAAALAKP